eukprot:8316420-Pyramimonas_sp.AAC.1
MQSARGDGQPPRSSSATPGTNSSDEPSRWQRTPPPRPSGPADGRSRPRPPPGRFRAREVPA